MRSILVLTAVIALLATYLESTGRPGNNLVPKPFIAKVIRSQNHQAARAVSGQAHYIKRTVHAVVHTTVSSIQTQALNLKLPYLMGIQGNYNSHKSTLLNLFNRKRSPEISLNAELVYDADKGEDITGGKVNVTIPFG
jgi:hypothetical protein